MNEIVDEAIWKEKEALMFKVDFEKQYNQFDWKYIEGIMRKMGLHDKWRGWVSCLKSTTISVLVNGSLTK